MQKANARTTKEVLMASISTMAGKALVKFNNEAPKDLPPNFIKLETSDKMFRVDNMTPEQLIAKLNEDDFLIEQVLLEIFQTAERAGNKLTEISEFTYQQVQKSKAELEKALEAETA
jgi:hypothetical protein